MKKVLKLSLFGLETILLFIVIGGLTTAITKNVYADILIEQFKSQAGEVSAKSSQTVKLYPIKSNEDRPCLNYVAGDYYPGNTGDILLSLTSELKIPFVKDFISFFAGGHAALILGNYTDYDIDADVLSTLESTGLAANSKAIVSDRDYWLDDEPYKEVICVRVKTTAKQRQELLVNTLGFYGDPYNYSFIFDTINKSYCSDLVAKAYESIGVNLNKDGFTVSVYDLLVSGETYICYYHYFDNMGVKHIYYLDERS